jgi:hypothetical protein
MIEVARAYYLHERSKVEIAKQFDLSRFQVARLLDSARQLHDGPGSRDREEMRRRARSPTCPGSSSAATVNP